MRQNAFINFLWPRTRQSVLAAVLGEPHRAWYRSEMARRLRVRPSTLQRELEGLTRAGVLRSRRDGNRTYFQADMECPFLSELRGIVEKTVGVVGQVCRALAPFSDRVRFAFVFGSIARESERSGNDVDLMVVGSVGMTELIPTLRTVERRVGRPVNAHSYAPPESAARVHAGNHVLSRVLAGKMGFVVGGSHDLDAILAARPGGAPHDNAPRTRRPSRGRRSKSG